MEIDESASFVYDDEDFGFSFKDIDRAQLADIENIELETKINRYDIENATPREIYSRLFKIKSLSWESRYANFIKIFFYRLAPILSLYDQDQRAILNLANSIPPQVLINYNAAGLILGYYVTKGGEAIDDERMRQVFNNIDMISDSYYVDKLNIITYALVWLG